MSVYVLDTDILTLLQHHHPIVVQHAAAHRMNHAVVISVISVEEQLSGWYQMVRQAKKKDTLAQAYQHLADTAMFLGNLKILSLNEAAIDQYVSLRNLKLKVGRKDLQIAAIALESHATIVTRNLRDFQRVPNLPVVDWSI
jgi:tRNA(fMet)-specific endonuclease VapC